MDSKRARSFIQMLLKEALDKIMKLADMTWEEAEKYIKRNPNLIIPVGICEQHSTHLPLNTDTLFAEYICDYLSQKTGMLVAPTINYGIGLPCDSCYAGSSSIGYKDLKNTVISLIAGWKRQGFKKFFIISAHGDPFHIKALESTGHKNVYILELYAVDLGGILEKQKCAKHACEAETSVMLHLFPKAVRKKKITDFETPFKKFRPYLYHVKKSPIPGSPGCQGYPSRATKKKGAKIIGLIKKNALNRIKKLACLI